MASRADLLYAPVWEQTDPGTRPLDRVKGIVRADDEEGGRGAIGERAINSRLKRSYGVCSPRLGPSRAW
jgi:hypothetical protein